MAFFFLCCGRGVDSICSLYAQQDVKRLVFLAVLKYYKNEVCLVFPCCVHAEKVREIDRVSLFVDVGVSASSLC